MFKLFKHQEIGINFGLSHKNIIIADEMGLGKTAQSILISEKLNFKNTLIVCKNSAKKKWKDEVLLWTEKDCGYILDGTSNNKDKQLIDILNSQDDSRKFVITNYEHIRTCKTILDVDINCLIIDEAHKIKNRKSQIYKSIKRFCNATDKIILVTGSPMANRPEEIWSLLNVLYPQVFKSFWKFVERYCYVTQGYWGWEIDGSKNEQELRNVLSDIMIRRLKKDCLDLPDKNYINEYVTLEGKQRSLYEQIEKDAMAIINETEVLTASIVIAQIIRMKQIAISPELVGEEKETNSAKFNWLLNFIEEYPEEKIVIFSFFERAISSFTKLLSSKNIKYVRYTGKENLQQRELNEKEFRFGKTNIFLATTSTGGESIDLFESNICIFLDKHWNPEMNKQAEDRLHRIGQKRTVTIISLIAENTYDEIIENMLKDKKNLIAKILEWRKEKDDKKIQLQSNGRV